MGNELWHEPATCPVRTIMDLNVDTYEAFEPASPSHGSCMRSWLLPEEAGEAASVLMPRLQKEMQPDKLSSLICNAEELADWEVPGAATEVWVATERLKQLRESQHAGRVDPASTTGIGVSWRL